MAETKLDDLAHAVRAAGIRSPAEFHALNLALCEPEKALFLALSEGAEVPAQALRRLSDGLLSNVSLTAAGINRKLTKAGDSRRVVCRVAPRPVGRGTCAYWRLAEALDGAA